MSAEPRAPVLLTLDLLDPAATDALGMRFAQLLRAGDVLLLEGQIGAGKTQFSRALIRALLAREGREEDIPSPTFTLVQTYDTRPEVWHADLYRLTHPDEAVELGLEDAFETALCLIEWPERLGTLTPARALRLHFSPTRDGLSRQVTLSGEADWAARLAAAEITR